MAKFPCSRLVAKLDQKVHRLLHPSAHGKGGGEFGRVWRPSQAILGFIVPLGVFLPSTTWALPRTFHLVVGLEFF